MNKKISQEIINILKEEIKNPAPELDFNNNYELLIAVVLSAQTTDKRVNIVTKDLFNKYQNFYDLSNASILDVKEIINTLGFSNSKSKNIIELSKIIVDKYNGVIPQNFKDLESLPGVGHKTASVVLALGYNIPSIPVDTHLYRMAKRLGYIKENDSIIKAEESYKKYIDKNEWILSHHLFLLFARYKCKAISPLCLDCKLKKYCKFKSK